MTPRSVLITGASSGIGRALALALAQQGTTLHLSGRNEQRLMATADACRSRGAEAHPRILDVTDVGGMAAWISAVVHLDLVFANAGIAAGTGSGGSDGILESAEQVRAIFATNVDGVFNTVLPALAVMQAQAPDANGVRGRIAVTASLAALIAYPGSPSYCGSKAAVDYWTVASAPSARACGVVLTSICPGFVRSAMTEKNTFPMPGLIDAEQAAQIILRAVFAGKRREAFPWWMALGARFVQSLPLALSSRFVADQKSVGPLSQKSP